MASNRKSRYRPAYKYTATKFATKVTRQWKRFSITCAGSIVYASGDNELCMTPYLTPSTKINSRWIIHLHVKGKTMKLPYHTGESINDIEVSQDFLNRTEKSLTLRKSFD